MLRQLKDIRYFPNQFIIGKDLMSQHKIIHDFPEKENEILLIWKLIIAKSQNPQEKMLTYRFKLFKMLYKHVVKVPPPTNLPTPLGSDNFTS